MSKNRYVGNLSFHTTADLREAFGRFGSVIRAQVITDREPLLQEQLRGTAGRKGWGKKGVPSRP